MENIRVNAVFRLGKEDYPERERTTIVITDDGDEVLVGVKAITRVFERNDKGYTIIHDELHGDYCTLRKDMTLGCLFDSLKELFDKVPEIIDKTTSNSDKA